MSSPRRMRTSLDEYEQESLQTGALYRQLAEITVWNEGALSRLGAEEFCIYADGDGSVYEVTSTPQANQYKVWTGRLESRSYICSMRQ
jgi:hypothetical protein